MPEGRVLCRSKNQYTILDRDNNFFSCRIKSSLFKDSKYKNKIAVGELVTFQKKNNIDNFWITEKLPRKNFVVRKSSQHQQGHYLLVNIDQLFIVTATQEPAFQDKFILKILFCCIQNKIPFFLILTKTDLVSCKQQQDTIDPYIQAGIPIFCHSLHEKTSPMIKNQMKGKVNGIIGLSGVGKTSLINSLFPTMNLKVQPISKKTKSGKHTTTLTRMFVMEDNTIITDTVGIQNFFLYNVTKQMLSQYFPSFLPYASQCRYQNCLHKKTNSCAVIQAVEDKNIPIQFYNHYFSILEEIDNFIK